MERDKRADGGEFDLNDYFSKLSRTLSILFRLRNTLAPHTSVARVFDLRRTVVRGTPVAASVVVSWSIFRISFWRRNAVTGTGLANRRNLVGGAVSFKHRSRRAHVESCYNAQHNRSVVSRSTYRARAAVVRKNFVHLTAADKQNGYNAVHRNV